MLPSRMFLSKDVTYTAIHFDYIDIPFAEGTVVRGGKGGGQLFPVVVALFTIDDFNI